VFGLSGVAPRAYIGNYRVFTVPSPVGNVANTPEIAKAFELAIKDGMDVINFSGGGPTAEPANDALLDVVDNTAAAGVVPVISAGNDREEFGLGSVGSPGTAPGSIAVAAVSNNHLFASTIMLTSPDGARSLREFAYRAAPTVPASPARWENFPQTLVDVGAIKGRNGSAVDRHLCGTERDPNGPGNQLPAGSLKGAIALVQRGLCSFVSKAVRARRAGAIGVVIVNDRPGEAGWPILPLPRLPLPMGMIADIDGRAIQAALAASRGRGPIRVTRDVEQIETGRGDVVTSFSSAGPTAFGHQLKPDVAAPGGSILSSTLSEFAGSPFAVFDGTSMAAPHVAGAAALLLQRHPTWAPKQVKSALVQTAGPAYGDTGRTTEAPVTLEGSGLVNIPRADDPGLFADPVSFSFGDLDLNAGPRSRTRSISLQDAGSGAGTWRVTVQPQSTSQGTVLTAPPFVAIPPGGTIDLQVVAHASAGAAAGDDYGFVTLTRGASVRRIPYLLFVTRPGLELSPKRALRLRRFQRGDTRDGRSFARVYRFPSAPFGAPPNVTAPPVDERGAEDLFVTTVKKRVANVGVAVVESTPADAYIHPWFLGSRDENDVQGYAGTPVNINGFMFDYLLDIRSAGVSLPRRQRFFVSVDSGVNVYRKRTRPGRYRLRFWVNDVRPPSLQLLTTRVAAGRPTLVARVRDAGAGVDPYSLVLGYRFSLVLASAYDPDTGLALFPLTGTAPRLHAGKTPAEFVASDFQEAKNVNTSGKDVMPNTTFRDVTLKVVAGPAVTWLLPAAGGCTGRRTRLVVAASSTRGIAPVKFLDGARVVATARRDAHGLYSATWSTGHSRRGRHVLLAVVHDAGGRAVSAPRAVRVCR
jgi:subtilisin family serine protease